MTKTLKTEVLIVGAGPTGLMAANQLMRFGIDFIIVDTKGGPTRESRAIVVTARSLEIYQQMGLGQEVIEGGKIMRSLNLYSKGKRIGEVIIGEIGKGQSEFSYMLAFEQSKNEEMLARNLSAHGMSIHWHHEFLKLTEYKRGIEALVTHNGEILNISAQYLIACGGANSPVRQQLGFSFKGGTYKHKFFVADTDLQWDLEYDKLILSPGDQNFCAFLPLRGDRGYRVIGTLPKEYFDNEDISFRDIENVVVNTLGIDVKFEAVNWFSLYKLHHRGVDHFSEGRVFLAGDSAHIHSPAGGQGMNTGLQDAYNLCWKLAFVLRKQAKEPLLDTYNEERLPFARWLLKFTDRGFNMMTSSNWFIKLVRKYVVLKLAGMGLKSSRLKGRAFKIVSQTGYSYHGRSLSKNLSKQKLKFQAGDRLPYFPDDNIYQHFTGATFHLLHIDSEPLNGEVAEKLKSAFPFTVKIVEDQNIEKWKKLGVKFELFILVRPDNYVALILDNYNGIDLRNYLKEYFI